jgi:hypothetical protein
MRTSAAPATIRAMSRIAEPKLILLALGAIAVMVLCIVGIADTDAVWLVLLTVLAVGLIALAIVVDLRRVIDAEQDTPEDVPSDHAHGR